MQIHIWFIADQGGRFALRCRRSSFLWSWQCQQTDFAGEESLRYGGAVVCDDPRHHEFVNRRRADLDARQMSSDPVA